MDQQLHWFEKLQTLHSYDSVNMEPIADIFTSRANAVPRKSMDSVFRIHNNLLGRFIFCADPDDFAC